MNGGVLHRSRELLMNHAVSIRILIGKNMISDANETQGMELPKITGNHANCQIRFDEKAVHTKVTTFIIDNEISLIVESKDETKENLDEMIGLATYSNSESTVSSYTSIFETS